MLQLSETRHFHTTLTTCIVILFISFIKGNPMPPTTEWAVDFEDSWDVTGGRGDQYSILSNDSVPYLLVPQNYTHNLPPSLSPEQLKQMEEEKHRQFNILKVNCTEMIDGSNNELGEGLRSGQDPLQSLDKDQKLLNSSNVLGKVEDSFKSTFTCTACKTGIGMIKHYLDEGKTTEDVSQMVYLFCSSFKIASEVVCKGIAEIFVAQMVYILQRTTVSPGEICNSFIDHCDDTHNPERDWNVIFPPVPKPAVTEAVAPMKGAPTFKVLHLADLHLDPFYEEGANSDCNEPLCCHLENGPPTSPDKAAGPWGTYHVCDTPRQTIENMYQHISNTHPDIDYIILTGDLPPHGIWNQTKEGNLMILRETMAQIKKSFPGIPFFPTVGNHESHPVDSFPQPYVPEEFSISWLYDEVDKQWQQWLPPSVSRTVRQGAFYSVLVRPGFRIISLNMNYCNNKNFWLLLNNTDPAKELQWFIYELQSAELNHEKVHVVGHIPPGRHDCVKEWSKNYYEIINRYESTVTAQFFSHTHFDEFELFYDTNNISRVTNVAYIGPSVTTFVNLNPGYRIYYVDGDHNSTTRRVVDHETWVLNLDEANKNNNPVWYKLYSARSAYQMPSLLPQDWDNLLIRLASDKELFDLYYRYYWKNSPMRSACDDKCKEQMLCDLRTGNDYNRTVLCQELKRQTDARTQMVLQASIYSGDDVKVCTQGVLDSGNSGFVHRHSFNTVINLILFSCTVTTLTTIFF